MSVVAFCQEAPKAHMANVADLVDAYLARAHTAAISQRGLCEAFMNNRGWVRSPRSTGFSTTNSVPAWCASSNREHMRETTSFARLSSARCFAGRNRQPLISCLVRTGGGPPSFEVSELKNLEIENVPR